MNPQVHIHRTKLRRVVEQAMKTLNKEINDICVHEGLVPFHLKYTNHFIDDMITRDISIDQIFGLLNKCKEKVHEFSSYYSLPYPPRVEEPKDPDIIYRPTRLELTDGELWIGMTSDKPLVYEEATRIGMTCRMAIVNNVRLPSRVSCQLIKV